MKINSSITDFIPEIETVIHNKHPRDVLSSAKKIAESININDQAVNRRVDELISIDWVESKDLDDAYTIEKMKNWWYMIKVAISDVSESILPLTNIDLEAFKRSTSVYFENYSIPMIPKSLSEDKLSLNHNQSRLTLTVQIELDEKYDVKQSFIYESVTYNKNRFDYKSFSDDFMNIWSEYHELFDLSYYVAKKLYLKRLNKWAIDYDESDRRIMIWRNIKLWKNIAQLIIQEFMILANKEVAKFTSRNNLNSIYRNHMSRHKWEDVSWYKFLERASYDEVMKYHLWLAEEYYTHFTSPIRRYADLIIHRVIKQHLRNDEPIYTSSDIEEICNYINLKISATVIWQKKINYNSSIIRRLRKADNKVHNEKTEKVYFMDQVKKHTHQKIRLPEEVVEKIIEQIELSDRIPSWIIQTFIISKENEIIIKMKEKALQWFDYKRTINIINNVWKTNSNRLWSIEIVENINWNSHINKDTTWKIDFLFNNKIRFSEEWKIINIRKKILEKSFNYIIQKNIKN